MASAANGGGAGARGRDSGGDGVEDRDPVGAVLEELAALAGRDARHDAGAVVEREPGMAGAELARDALDEDLGFGSDDDGHGKSRELRELS